MHRLAAIGGPRLHALPSRRGIDIGLGHPFVHPRAARHRHGRAISAAVQARRGQHLDMFLGQFVDEP